MPLEIERKFLIKNDSWKNHIESKIKIAQGFLNDDPHRTIRIRVTNQDAFLTIKGKMSGISRPEYEYKIPLKDATELLKMCKPNIISKTRYIVNCKGHKWEIDIFHGENEGLMIAEIELENEHETFSSPNWLGKEVSQESRYLNVMLSKLPYSKWESSY